MQVFTLGYEGLNPEVFVTQLKNNNVQIIIDVREIPWSRKKGFSKSQLENLLTEKGIRYVHLKKLGSPSLIRKKVRANADYTSFFKEYTSYIETQENELLNLLQIIEKTICCLMCFEKNVEMCHRKIVALKLREMTNNKLEVIHL